MEGQGPPKSASVGKREQLHQVPSLPAWRGSHPWSRLQPHMLTCVPFTTFIFSPRALGTKPIQVLTQQQGRGRGTLQLAGTFRNDLNVGPTSVLVIQARPRLLGKSVEDSLFPASQHHPNRSLLSGYLHLIHLPLIVVKYKQHEIYHCDQVFVPRSRALRAFPLLYSHAHHPAGNYHLTLHSWNCPVKWHLQLLAPPFYYLSLCLLL